MLYTEYKIMSSECFFELWVGMDGYPLKRSEKCSHSSNISTDLYWCHELSINRTTFSLQVLTTEEIFFLKLVKCSMV